MSIIFRAQKFLKENWQVISLVIILCIVISLIASAIISKKAISKTKAAYDNQVKITETLQKENTTLKIEKESLENEIQTYHEQLTRLTEENNQLITKLEDVEAKLASKNSTTSNKGSSQSNISGQSSSKSDAQKSNGSGYEQATYVWNYLTSTLKLNKYVSAGIMGNIMAEVGGQTLDISRWPQYSQGYYYGICQWSDRRKNRLLNDYGRTLEAQVKFLGVELFEVIKSGNSFYEMQDEREAALYFAKKYERCGSGSYSVRQSNATKALNYFTGK